MRTCVLMSFLLALPAAGQEAPKPIPPDAVAKAVLDAMVKGDFATASKDFDAKVAKALSVEDVGKLWKSLTVKFGALRKQGPPRMSKTAGYDVVTISCEFEKITLDMRVSVKDGKIGGIGFVPGGTFDFKPPPYAKQDTFIEKQIVVGADGKWPLPATLTLPKGAGPFPAVVLVHGSGAHDRDETIIASKPFRDLAWGLGTEGIAVLRYIKRNQEHGARMVKDKGLTIKEEAIEDAIEAAALLCKQKEIDPKRVFVVGHSLGAFVAPRIGTESAKVAGLVLLAGNSRPLEDLIVEQFTYLFSLDDKEAEANRKALEKIKEQVGRVKDPKLNADTTGLPLGLSGAYWMALKAYDPATTAAHLKKPMFILQGERDQQVSMDDFAGWKKALAGRTDVTFKSYPNLHHLFMTGSGKGKSKPEEYAIAGHVDREVIGDIAAWIKKR